MAERAVDTEANVTGDPSSASTMSSAPNMPLEVSDGEEERAARERLKKTSLAGMSQHPDAPVATGKEPGGTEETNGTGARGRPAKKRSFEDLARGEDDQDDALPQQPSAKSGHHKRMRSRDVAGGGGPEMGKYKNEVGSPVREESDTEAQQSPGGPGVLVNVPREGTADKNNNSDGSHLQQAALAPADDGNSANISQSHPSSVPSSTNTAPGLANTSVTSPFGNAQVQSKTSSESHANNTTSASAFAASGLSAFASSEKSPFGAANLAQSSGGFGGGAATTPFGSSTGGFGSSGSSVFGAKPASGFGTSSSGFGSGSGFGTATGFGASRSSNSGLSGFASRSGSSFGPSRPLGTSKPIGLNAEKEEDDDGSESEEGDTEGQGDETEQDERFVEQRIDTGESEEETIFQCRAKIYRFDKEWKDRGTGVLKLNVKDHDAQSEQEGDQARTEELPDIEGQTAGRTRRKARLILRVDRTHNVALNTPIYRGMVVGQVDGSEPTGKTMHLSGMEEGKPTSYQIKIGKEDELKDLYWRLVELRTSL